MSMVDVASLICFTRLCKNILILTKPRANAQRVVKSVVIPNRVSVADARDVIVPDDLEDINMSILVSCHFGVIPEDKLTDMTWENETDNVVQSLKKNAGMLHGGSNNGILQRGNTKGRSVLWCNCCGAWLH